MTESKLGDLQVQYVGVEEIDPHPENANVGNLDAIVESIRINGYYSPMIVQSSTGYILAGNHRYQAAMALGYEMVPVIYVDVDDEEGKRIMVADNRTTRLGHDDDESLAALLTDLGDSEVGLLGTGFNQADLQTLQDHLENFDEAYVPEPDAPESDYENDFWVIEPVPGPDGTCSSVLVHRSDRREVSADDFNKFRQMLGMSKAPRGALATMGIERWA